MATGGRLPVLVVYMVSRLIALVEKPITKLFKPNYVTFLAIFHYELAFNQSFRTGVYALSHFYLYFEGTDNPGLQHRLYNPLQTFYFRIYLSLSM